jgi:hypothetical protein
VREDEHRNPRTKEGLNRRGLGIAGRLETADVEALLFLH